MVFQVPSPELVFRAANMESHSDSENFDFLGWLFSEEKTPPRSIPDEGYLASIFSVKDSYDFAADETSRIYGSEEAEKLLRKLRLQLFLSPFIATFVFLSFVYSVKLAYKNGRPFLITMLKFMQQTLQEEENNLEFRLSSVENALSKSMKNQQNSCSENLKTTVENLIDSHSDALHSTQVRLGDLTDAIQRLLQASVPLERRVGSRDLIDSPWNVGDSSRYFVNKT